KKYTVPELKRVYDNIKIKIVGKPGVNGGNINSVVYQVLSLSYEDLPMELKHCFLYLAHFPEDYKIYLETLFPYWASEGIITSFCNGATIQESGEDFLDELVRRNLVFVERLSKYFQMHDIMRESDLFCVFGAKGYVWKQSAQCFRSSPLLRVLDLDYVEFEGGKFLSLQGAFVSHLPSSLRNLKLLLYLNLSLRDVPVHGPVHVPNILKEMLELRFLCLPLVMDHKTKLELDDLVNLEKLGCFSTKHSKVTDLLRMTRLRELHVNFTGETAYETLSSSLRELKNLQRFAIVNTEEPHHKGDFALDFIHLTDLSLSIHMARFPDQYQFPPNLARICLQFCRMEEDPMPILEKLLHLKSIELTDRGFIGKRMVCSKGGFSQLYDLRISELEELEEWIVAEGSMPCLRTLTIGRCEKLKEIPEGLKYITFQKELVIEKLKREWTKKLVPGGEDYYKVQHIPNVQFINCDGE
ncbi:hypothetical protein EUTSA_v10012230mg, partial [Eutrema salsugineum]